MLKNRKAKNKKTAESQTEEPAELTGAVGEIQVEDLKRQKRGNRLLFLIGGGIVFAIAFFVALIRISGGEEEVLQAADYSMEGDSVPSITTVTQAGELIRVVPSQDEGHNQIEYVYQLEENSDEVVSQYITYLETEEGFMELTPQVDDRIAAENTQQEEREHAAFVRQSADTQSGEERMFQLDMNRNDEEKEYSVTISRPEGQLPQQEEEEDPSVTRGEALNVVINVINENGLLPRPMEEYTQVFDVGRSIINGMECYGINVYETGPSGYNVFVAKYFISVDLGHIYSYASETGTYERIQ